MNAEIITIGDEILLGQIVDTNSAWISQQLDTINIRVNQITSISDNSNDILHTLTLASQRANIILVTGGLGPTKDDITKETISKYFNKTLVRDDEVWKHVQTLFARVAPNKPIPLFNQNQAEVLAGCQVLFNDVGTAPGMYVEKDSTIYIFMPGVPFEMKYLMTHRVLPKLRTLVSTDIIHHRHIITIGLGESFLAERIADIENNLPSTIKLAYLPKLGLVRLRLTELFNHSNFESEIDYYHTQIIERLQDHVIAIRDISIEEAIVETFSKENLKLAIAESCTGGSIASGITAISGASAMFDCGVVAYHNQIKQNILGVQKQTLEEFGAVSEQTVIEMAEGVKRLAHADYAIATSGIAGPGGGTDDKPVGTVWIAVSGLKETYTKLFNFHNDRNINIERSVAQAFTLLWNMYVKDKRAKEFNSEN